MKRTKFQKWWMRLRHRKKILQAITNLNEDQKGYRKRMLKEGKKDDVCPKCLQVFLAHHHFINCVEARCDKCPMVKPGTKSLLEQALGK